MLLARRLIESGVRLVTVCAGRRFDQAWDTHRQHFPLLKRSLLPYTDRRFPRPGETYTSAGCWKRHWWLPSVNSAVLPGSVRSPAEQGPTLPDAITGRTATPFYWLAAVSAASRVRDSDQHAAYPEKRSCHPRGHRRYNLSRIGELSQNPADRFAGTTLFSFSGKAN